MGQRLEYRKASPEAIEAMLQMEGYVRRCGLEKSLLELVKTRTSQINDCAYCLDMHTKDARAEGETEQRLYTLEVWRETPFFTEQEREALAWTEALTELAVLKDVPDDVYENLRRQFNEKEMVDLTLAIITINGWNRFGVGFRPPPGKYEPRRSRK